MSPRTLPCLAGALLCALASATGAEIYADLPYASAAATSDDASTARRLDIYAPDGRGRDAALPVVVYVHGGGWSGGSKARIGHKPEGFNRQSLLLVSVEYRLLPAGRHPAAAEDLAAALAWLATHVGDYGGDPEALFLLGHSSGGHVVSLVATDPAYLAAHGLEPERIRGVVALDSNAFEVGTLVRLLPPPARQRYLDVFGDQPQGWREASPAYHLAAGKRIPPFLLLVAGAGGAGGATELLNRRFAAGLEAAGLDVVLEVFADQTHGSINAELGTPGHAPTTAVTSFVERLLAQARRK